MVALIIIIVIIILIIFASIGTYNGLISQRQMVKNAFGQMDVQLQRRFDLIPNLVECVKGYMAHESSVLEKVTQLRSSWSNAKTVEDKANVNNELSSTLKTIMAVSENYPDLKANGNFLQLQGDLKDTEEKVAYARQFYNDIVTKYNTHLQVFPSSIIASMFHFESEQLFQADNDETRKNVKVDFGTNNQMPGQN